jgi:hypothetical protein
MQRPNELQRVVELRPLRLDAYPDYGEEFEDLEEGGWLWVREENTFAWEEARLVESLAFCHWCRMRDASAYSIDRAAPDRADAAQDALILGHPAERASEALER